MKKHLPQRLATAACFVLFTSVLVSCSKEDLTIDTNVASKRRPTTTITDTSTSTSTATNTTTTTTTAAISTTTTTTAAVSSLYNLSVNWNSRTNGAYGLLQATEDFKNTVYWNAPNSQTNGGMLQATLVKNIVGPDGGVMSRFDVVDGSEYQLQFDLMFDSLFDWSAGGKVGFGFLIGEGYTGGANASDGNGGSARIMWEKNSSGRVYLKPYLYYKDQPGTYGDNLGKTYPASGSIEKGKWYTVNMYVKSNTGYNTDGRVKMVINGTTVLDQSIRWTTNDLKRLINKVSFENFRGGSDAYWQSSTDGKIYFDNVSWSALKY